MDPLTQNEKEAELHELIIEGGTAVRKIGKLLKKYPGLVNARGRYNNTLLIRAAVFGRDAIVRLLLEKGANTDLKNETGFTALMAAAMEHRVSIIRMLLNAGATVGTKDTYGKTARDYAEEGESRHKDAAMQLLDGNSPATDPSPLRANSPVRAKSLSPARTGCHGTSCSIMGGRRTRRRKKAASKIAHT
jgi:hypothetical protein